MKDRYTDTQRLKKRDRTTMWSIVTIFLIYSVIIVIHESYCRLCIVHELYTNNNSNNKIFKGHCMSTFVGGLYDGDKGSSVVKCFIVREDKKVEKKKGQDLY